MNAVLACILGLSIGVTSCYMACVTNGPPPKQCPGEVVSMVIDRDGAVLCTYMLVPQGVVTKQKEMKK